jgi:hypothetical protein
MTDVSLLSSSPAVPVLVLENTGNSRDLIYLVVFAAVGLFSSMMSLALTTAEWLPEEAITIALSSAG